MFELCPGRVQAVSLLFPAWSSIISFRFVFNTCQRHVCHVSMPNMLDTWTTLRLGMSMKHGLQLYLSSVHDISTIWCLICLIALCKFSFN